MIPTVADFEALAARLLQHAAEYAHTESEPNRPGSLAFDLKMAGEWIPMLLMNIKHSDPMA